MNSKDYETARAEHSKAYHIYDDFCTKYQKRLIGDDEFLKARKAYDQATALYDKAWLKEQGISNNE